MNCIIKTLTITASALLLTAGQAALADSIGESAKDVTAEAFDSPAIEPADTPSSFIRVTVAYADLNLESEEGVRVLYRLLQRASKEVCAGKTMPHGRSVIMKSSRLRCYRESLSNAVKKIDNENLTRFHAG